MGKRGLDLFVSVIALVSVAPIQLAVGAAVAMSLGRPVLFKQERPGKDGRVFLLQKFRTMKSISEHAGLVTDAQRLTRFGNFLRSTSLDELPTIWNVVKGDMSLVGPRPLLVQYLSRYSLEQNRRHEVRPGITGLAQVSGRNFLGWEQKFEFDVRYVDTRSFRLDAKILVQTIRLVLRRDGIASEGHVTAPEFLGTSVRKSAA